jgi:hypothetical protein
VHGHVVAAHRIVRANVPVGIRQLAIISRPARMIENYVLIKFFKVHG